MVKLFQKIFTFSFMTSGVFASTQFFQSDTCFKPFGGGKAQVSTQTSPTFRSSTVCSGEVVPMKVDLRAVPFQDLEKQILQAASSNGMVALNLSGKGLYDDSIESLMYALQDETVWRNIVEISLSDNNISVKGLQSLLPVLEMQGFRILDVSGNCIEGEDIFEKLGTNAAYDKYSSVDGRVILDRQTHGEIAQKIIWMPSSFFGGEGQEPTGMYVTPEVINRHRLYYGNR